MRRNRYKNALNKNKNIESTHIYMRGLKYIPEWSLANENLIIQVPNYFLKKCLKTGEESGISGDLQPKESYLSLYGIITPSGNNG